jgi:hypothetical protein
MSEPMDQLRHLLQESALREPVSDFMTSLVEQEFDRDGFATRTAAWLDRFQEAQARFSREQEMLQARQGAQLAQLDQEQKTWEARFREVSRQLGELHQQNLETEARYLELLAEVHAAPDAVPSAGLQRRRLAMVLAFLPLLPTVVSKIELAIVFSGIDISLPNPYLPPRDAAVRLALEQFEQLPGCEQNYLHARIDGLKSAYRLQPHPLYLARRKTYQRASLSLISTLRRILHERAEAE